MICQTCRIKDVEEGSTAVVCKECADKAIKLFGNPKNLPNLVSDEEFEKYWKQEYEGY